ncbi:ABC-F family ATP-binding cassette domain-containing protein [Shouchella clausii]|uniref:ABC-F family ATP-binding cassette domain-containing protein n=1 Tax=Shouchella clausii TaxID=79880 RepID=UPI000B95DE9E|nr:ABC-F family ATP-binding cassette domain-containing protein [Shouchella clausii]AST94810.1 multidrug ABC transporter ATP-binding protein [Shouchella clausii]MEB5474722.1 ABC-F family ATP-binding cassette domain-containing protein [Shouchella clausii]QNM45250.1 ABC transporter ATP-binding protein [Shouchella clausii]WQG96031.1 ABC-F family ATP-binding cassette domain-containing protein [Shouchella clausii]
MIVLQCVNVSKAFGTEPVLEQVKLEVQAKDRVGLVGRNGAGKSTLLKIITGEISQDTGEIVIPKQTTIGYLAQHTGLASNRSIWDEMLEVFAPLLEMERSLRTLEQQMADPDAIEQNNYQKLLAEYDQLQLAFKDSGGYQYEADIRSVLAGLHFHHFDYSTAISTLSGGQKTRLALAKLLLSKPDILVLDEPTNHLDMETLSWLEQYLANYSGAILVVSHDRYFLDKLVTKTVELSRGKTTTFHGNYSHYLDEKAKRYQQAVKQYEKQQEEVAKLETFVAKNIARASTTKRAQSRRKQLEKIDMIDRPDGEKSVVFSFNINKQTGNDVLTIRDLTAGYGQGTVFEGLHLSLTRGESVGLIGENGAGKSTLLKAITQQLSPQKGSIIYGSNVVIGYYDQEQAKLSSNKTVLHELWDEYPTTPEKDVRAVLGRFLFTGDDVLKPVSSLSGGEKARVALAKLMMQQANFLILDEPTNHLDLDAKEVLEAALLDYPGTILFVSHDRYFINRLATRIIELDQGGTNVYLGNYNDYLEKKRQNAERAALKKEETLNKQAAETDRNSFQLDKEAKRQERQKKRRIEAIETEMEQIEASISALHQQLADPDVYTDHQKAQTIQAELEQQNNALEALMEEWETLST